MRVSLEVYSAHTVRAFRQVQFSWALFSIFIIDTLPNSIPLYHPHPQ